ncbi:DUF6801 domain-containing protein [Actinomadura rupiterrae]|uniref:DUF6801 domain-containing protein n=1 Tax=Actinomadura rupiterrae TaxID=559627 RepID=UPI0020A60A9F|nr:DUF6801 domain-containing protein [Actinomadura rupiterrae]MCP2339131.1 hypothetical protein [Actinomadura rupiterrae]
MSSKSRALRKGAAIGASAGVVVGLAGALGAGTASAAPASPALASTHTFNYTCTYPLIGKRPLKVAINTNIPEKLGVSQNTGKIQFTWTATLGDETTSGLNAVDGATIEGSAEAKAQVVGPGYPNGVSVSTKNALEPTQIPSSGSFQIKGYGEAPGISFDSAGQITAKLGDMNLNVLLKKKDGTPGAMGTFKAPCTMDAGQDATVASGQVVDGDQTLPSPITAPSYFPYTGAPVSPGQLSYALNLKGNSFIKSPNGNMPLDGNIGVKVDGATGAITGDLTLKKATGKMNILGFLPVDATVDFAQVGQTVGTYSNGEIKTTSTMYIKLPLMSLMGIPLGGGDQCQSSKPSAIDMFSTPGQFFNPKVGGPYKASNYTISDIVNCGPLNGILSIFTAGSGNTIDANLTPSA